jgi:cystathionine beta-lyase
MWEGRLGGLRFGVSHRQRRGDGGPVLQVYRADEPGRELLRFDCFHRQPHYHVDPGGRDEITELSPLVDNLSWVRGELARNLPGYLEKAGFEGDCDWAAEERDRLLKEAESAMRNPPLDLDGLDLEVLKSRLSEKWEVYPGEVLPAWVAEMDFPVAEPIRLVLQRAVDRFDVGYPIPRNRTGLREVFAERVGSRFGWEVQPQRVEIITDVVQGIYAALYAYAEAGEGAVVNTPIYPPFLQAVSETHRSLVESRLEPGPAGFGFDAEALREKVDDRTRVMLLCNPHNPTGRVFTRSELEQLASLAVQRDLVVVADEIHSDLVYPGGEHLPFATLGPEVASRTVTLSSATKAFNIAGLCCAVAHFGSESLQRRFRDCTPAHLLGGIGLLGIYATIAAWKHSQPWLDRVMAYLEDNRAFLRSFLGERLPGIAFHQPEATYLAWLDCRALDLPRSPGHFFLKRARVALSDGHHFGQGFEGFARINFATSRAILTQVLERMAAALEAHSGA